MSQLKGLADKLQEIKRKEREEEEKLKRIGDALERCSLKTRASDDRDIRIRIVKAVELLCDVPNIPDSSGSLIKPCGKSYTSEHGASCPKTTYQTCEHVQNYLKDLEEKTEVKE